MVNEAGSPHVVMHNALYFALRRQEARVEELAKEIAALEAERDRRIQAGGYDEAEGEDGQGEEGKAGQSLGLRICRARETLARAQTEANRIKASVARWGERADRVER